ncbi:unnamed protein product, partial [Polarella glacialis]
MLDEPDFWVTRRLQPHIESGEVAALPAELQWQCWEEFSRNPKDITERIIANSIKTEGLFNGDIIVFQPAPALSVIGPALPGQDAPGELEGAELARVAPAEDDGFSVLTFRDFAEMQANQVPLLVRLFSVEAPFCPEGMPATGSWSQVLPTGLASGEDHLEGAQLAGVAGARIPGEVASQEMTVNLRWRLDTFMAKVAKAFGVSEDVAAGQGFWLFDKGTPSSLPEPPLFWTEAPAPANTEMTLTDLLPRAGTAAAQHRWALNTVLLPARPAPTLRPLAIHFFDASVCEVGACILHVAETEVLDQESIPVEGEVANNEFFSGLTMTSITGRPAVRPAEILALARRHLADAQDATGRPLRQRLFGGDEKDGSRAA